MNSTAQRADQYRSFPRSRRVGHSFEHKVGGSFLVKVVACSQGASILPYELSTEYMALMPYLCSPIMPHSFYRQTVHIIEEQSQGQQ